MKSKRNRSTDLFDPASADRTAIQRNAETRNLLWDHLIWETDGDAAGDTHPTPGGEPSGYRILSGKRGFRAGGAPDSGSPIREPAVGSPHKKRE